MLTSSGEGAGPVVPEGSMPRVEAGMSRIYPGGALPETTLIVASRNRPLMLRDTIVSILGGDEVPSEVIVVDQSDRRDDALAALRSERCELRYHWAASRGVSRANNEGVAAARHGILVFTHDDVRVQADWFGTLVRALVAGGARTVVTGRVMPSTAEVAGGIVPTIKTDLAPAVYAGRIDDDPLYPLNMAMYRSALDGVGGFDERLGPGTPYPAAEDNDLGYRLLEAGYSIVYVPGAVVEHRAWRSDVVRLRWQYALGQGAYYAKHLSPRDRHMAGRLVRHLVRYAGRAVRRGVRLDRSAVGYAAATAGMLMGAARWLTTDGRRDSAARRPSA
jgi:GT2 family glycosyltransferase